MIDDSYLQRLAASDNPDVTTELAKALLAARSEIAALKQQLEVRVKLPYTSASPVCDIEAGYAAGVQDSKEAIRRAGFFIEGDE